MIDIKILLPELKKLVTELSDDLLIRVTNDKTLDGGLREAYTQIEKGGRTADAYEVWRGDYLDQVSVAWVLGCVFVRFMEDNSLIDECWLAGEGSRRQQADDSHELYFREHPRNSDRDYFEYVFREVGKIPACHDIFAQGKTPLWALGPSGDMAMKLRNFWRAEVLDVDTPTLKWSFSNQDGDTRFLGDLYQDLSQRARDKFALLQTPKFVESFILDHTLDAALEDFGIDEVRLIDPTCGSGHFLLGAFSRLFRKWSKQTDNEIVAAQKALDGVWGVDINPFAVAIARFRLIVAALAACGISRLKNAPAWNINLATGDSLLFGSRWDREGNKKAEQTFFSSGEESWAPDIYACEDKEAISEVLGQQYHAVVGNPPYIRSFDASRNDIYRDRYRSTSGKFTLTIPFFERFFDLCLGEKQSGRVGFITSGEFMRADFGKKLVNEFIPTIDLSCVIDTANVPLEGHGTNTVIIFGSNRPSRSEVRLVRGIAGETAPSEPNAESKVWQSILANMDVQGYEDEFISVADAPSELFCSHPWNIAGGGAAQIKDWMESVCKKKLKQVVSSIGIGFVTLKDKVFEIPRHAALRNGVVPSDIAPMLNGQDFRDWIWVNQSHVVFPYKRESEEANYRPSLHESTRKFLWSYRSSLWDRLWFKQTQRERNLEWWEFGHIANSKTHSPQSLFWGEITTHNNFGFDESGLVADRSAPIIKLKTPFDSEEAMGLLALLNSSVACLWLKQVCRARGGDHVGTKGARVRKNLWDERYQFASRKVSQFPIPDVLPSNGHSAYSVSREIYSNTFAALSEDVVPTAELIENARRVFENGISTLRALQEETDWECYRLYGLLDDKDKTTQCEEPPPLVAGQRAFEIRMARSSEGSEVPSWFTRHSIKPTTELPDAWSSEYLNVVRARLDAIESNARIRTLESPIYKRRWNFDSWGDIERRILTDWLLSRIEQIIWKRDRSALKLMSASEIADAMSSDSDFVSVGALLRGREDYDAAELVSELVLESSVPLLPLEVFSPAGFTKWRVWEDLWRLQRMEDMGVKDVILPKAPEFSSKDFASDSFWKLRKEMNVPMERFLSFPSITREGDDSLLIGWFGWNHLERATAIVAYYDARKREGWMAQRLVPLLAALDQLLPWIHQWHPEIDPEYNESAGTSFQTLLESEAQELGLTLEQIRNWTPPAKTRAAKKSAAKQPKQPRKKKAQAEVDE